MERSGDIILIFKDHTTGSELDRYTCGVACKAWHGSLNPSDSYVPLILAYPGGNKYELQDILDNVEGCETVDGETRCEGNWKVMDVIKELVSGQYKEVQ